VILRNTLLEVLGDQPLPVVLEPEVERGLLVDVPRFADKALVFKGVRRCGKSTLQRQLMRRTRRSIYCNFEDTRLFGLGPEDFPNLISVVEETAQAKDVLFFDEVQEVDGWQRLVRAFLDRGRQVCITGSNASLLGRELGAKLTGRHRSFEVFPFDYVEYRTFTGQAAGKASFAAFLEDGGFPSYLHDRQAQTLQELLRDVVQRDIALRHGLRETRHLMNLALYLLAHTGQPFSMQSLTKSLDIPSVGQTSRYLEYLSDAYVLLPLPKFSVSPKQHIVAPQKYYAVDNGLRRVNALHDKPDLGRRLENQVFLALRARGENLAYVSEKDAWECDFITDRAVIQVCHELTPDNQRRELEGLYHASRVPDRKKRKAIVLTFDQRDSIPYEGVAIEVYPAWQWIDKR